MNLIESSISLTKDKIGSPRSFGLIFSGFFMIIGLLPVIMRGKHPEWLFIFTSAIFLIVAVVRPGWLAYPNLAWIKFGKTIHAIVNPLIMLVLFCVTIVPTGILLRLFGKDVLRLKYDVSVDSYWIRKDVNGSQKSQMDKQF